jgi:hypothetical protein
MVRIQKSKFKIYGCAQNFGGKNPKSEWAKFKSSVCPAPPTFNVECFHETNGTNINFCGVVPAPSPHHVPPHGDSESVPIMAGFFPPCKAQQELVLVVARHEKPAQNEFDNKTCQKQGDR